MTREEARNQLKGTWNFDVHDDLVLVRDESLLAEIALLAGAGELSIPPQELSGARPGRRSSLSWCAAADQLFN